MLVDVLTIVGVGLIGGSIGLAARRRGVARQVRGVGRNLATLEKARDLGAVDDIGTEWTRMLPDSEMVVFCTPVDRIAENVLAAAPFCSPGTLLTDAGSTKSKILDDVESRLPGHVRFVGSHPLAGSEKRGPEHARADLFEGRWTVVTPTLRTDPRMLQKTKGFWEALGCRVQVMSPEAHDRALACTSHLPHLVAAALAGSLPSEHRELCATGFRDSTRIAAGDVGLWQAIFRHNRDALLESLHAFEDHLARFRLALEAGDWKTLDHLLTQAKKVRDALGN